MFPDSHHEDENVIAIFTDFAPLYSLDVMPMIRKILVFAVFLLQAHSFSSAPFYGSTLTKSLHHDRCTPEKLSVVTFIVKFWELLQFRQG
jgi:hypothetical protein